jgi:nucleotide-binding universal stress UspA family protein
MVVGSVSIKKILVPTSGLAQSVKACQYAAGLAKIPGAEIIGIHVIGSQVSRMLEERRPLGSRALPKVGPRLVSAPRSKGRQSQDNSDPALAVNH